MTVTDLANLERITVDGLDFDIRPGTSDEKSIREVVERRGYGRYKFAPAADEFWIDLGANIGAFSVWAASQDPSIRVHAYEADPTMCELVAHNLELNGLREQVEIFHSAVVADRRRTVTLHCNTARGNVWRNSIEREWRGGEDITVPAFNIKKVLEAVPADSYLKMDIEGTEMPILEWMLANHRMTVRQLAGMVFEWSFDVDRSIARFTNVIDGLSELYDEVKNARIPDDAPAEWPPQWNPPCRVVWAWNG
jgi:FkbM family methyltransferase